MVSAKMRPNAVPNGASSMRHFLLFDEESNVNPESKRQIRRRDRESYRRFDYRGLRLVWDGVDYDLSHTGAESRDS